MKFKKDQANEGGGWELPPPGTYEAEVLDAKEYTSRSGNPTLKLRLELEAVEDGRIFNEWLSLQDKMMWQVEKMLNSMGFVTEDDVDIDAETLIGRRCKVKIKHEENGEYTNCRVDTWFSTLPEESGEAAPKPKKKSSRQDYAVKKAMQKKREPQEPTSDESDDVPF